MNKKSKECFCSDLVVCKQHLGKFQHENKNNKSKKLSQVSTPAHIAELFLDLCEKMAIEERGYGINENDWVIDIAVGGGALLIPWAERDCVLIGADIDENCLELTKKVCPTAILYKHDSLNCKTPCSVEEHYWYNGFKETYKEKWMEELSKRKGQRFSVVNPPYEKNLPMKFVVKSCDNVVGEKSYWEEEKMNKTWLIWQN